MPLLNVSPVDRLYETLPNLDDINIPARAPQPDGATEDTQTIAAAFGDRIPSSDGCTTRCSNPSG